MKPSARTLFTGLILAAGLSVGPLAGYVVPALGATSGADAGGCPPGGAWGPHHGGHWSHHHGPRDGAEFMLRHMTRTLDLTDAQQKSVRAIFEKARPQFEADFKRMADNRRQMEALEAKTPLDEAAVKALAEAKGKIVADMTVRRAQVEAQIQQVLTPAQRDKLAKDRARWRERHFKGPQGGQPGPMSPKPAQ